MKKQKKKNFSERLYKQTVEGKKEYNPNAGFTLIELVVSVAITSIVLLAVALLISMAFNQYRISSMNANMQMDSQTALNQVANLIMECTSLPEQVSPAALPGINAKVYGLDSTDINKDPTCRIIVLDNDKHRLLSGVFSEAEFVTYIGSVDPDMTLASQISQAMVNDMITNPKQYILSSNVDTLELTNVTGTAIVNVDLNLKMDSINGGNPHISNASGRYSIRNKIGGQK